MNLARDRGCRGFVIGFPRRPLERFMGSWFPMAHLAKAGLCAVLRKRKSLQCADKGVVKTTKGTGGSMNVIGRLDGELERALRTFTIEALAKDIQPVILDVLTRYQKAKQRKSLLSPVLAVWLILAMALRRDLGYPNVLAWLLSGLRRVVPSLPRRLVKDGAITHARRRIGVDVLRELFSWTGKQAQNLTADFHGWTSVIVDGSQLTMPDTMKNA